MTVYPKAMTVHLERDVMRMKINVCLDVYLIVRVMMDCIAQE
jgi:hypothetical protein